MSKVIIHKYAGILSAFGMALADVVHEEQEPSALKYTPTSLPDINKRLASIKRQL